MNSTEKTPVHTPAAPEHVPDVAEELLEASLDLRSAIRWQVSKAIENHRKRYDLDMRLRWQNVKIRPIPTEAWLRNYLRQTQLDALGTSTEDDHMVRHFIGAYEDEESALRSEESADTKMVLTYVTHSAQKGEQEQPWYVVNFEDGRLDVYEDGRLLEANELDQPLRLIRQVRELYR